MVCKEDCSHSVPHDRRDGCGKCLDFCDGCIPVEPPEESKTEYKMKCKYCGDVQILNEKSFIEVIETGCESECWGCRKQGYEPVIPEGLFILSYENLIEVIQDHPFLELVDGEPEKDDDCPCDKEPVVWVVVAGRGELNWGCPDCRKIYGNWKPIHLRKKKECWLCEGTGSVMMDRQTGSMFAKEPTINWSEKDCYEHQCPNCGVDTESTIRIPEIVASEIERHVAEDVLYESIEDFVLSALRVEISLARRNPSLQKDQEGGK